MRTNVLITFKCNPEDRPSFLAILNQVKAGLPDVDGCESVRIFNDVSEPHTFTIVETWQSEAQHKRHIDGVVASGEWDRIASHLACDPVSSYYEEI